MVLANTEIVEALSERRLEVSGFSGQEDPRQSPFNTSSLDLRLSEVITRPKGGPMAVDLRRGGVSNLIAQQCDIFTMSREQPFSLEPGNFILGQTIERVNFPVIDGKASLSARIEGRSSLARCGILVHFTAPTIHAGFKGSIALEISNLGPYTFLLYPDLPVCQLIVEEVLGTVHLTPSQFRGQKSSSGN